MKQEAMWFQTISTKYELPLSVLKLVAKDPQAPRDALFIQCPKPLT